MTAARLPGGSRVLRPLVHIGYHKTGTTWLQNHLFARQDAGFFVPFDRKTTLNRILIEPYPLVFDADAARDALRPEVNPSWPKSASR